MALSKKKSIHAPGSGNLIRRILVVYGRENVKLKVNFMIKIKKILFYLFTVFLVANSSVATAYTGAKEIVVDKGEVKLHIIDYYKVMVVLSIEQQAFSKKIECGVFAFDEKRRIGKFGANVVYFGNKDFGYINNKPKSYAENKINLTLYRKVCNNFEIRK